MAIFRGWESGQHSVSHVCTCIYVHEVVVYTYAVLKLYAGRVEDTLYSQLSSPSLQSECIDVIYDINQLSSVLHEFVHMYGEHAIQIEDLCNSPDLMMQCPVTQNHLPGRPAFIISRIQLETLIDLGYSYSTISRMFGVSQRTLLRRRIEYDLPTGRRFTDISDNNLDIAVRGILQVGPLYIYM